MRLPVLSVAKSVSLATTLLSRFLQPRIKPCWRRHWLVICLPIAIRRLRTSRRSSPGANFGTLTSANGQPGARLCKYKPQRHSARTNCRDKTASPPYRARNRARNRIMSEENGALPYLQQSGTYSPSIIEDIQVKAELGRYRIRGFGTLRERRWPTFDDLTFLPSTL